MPNIFTVGDIVEAAKQQANMENSDFIDDAEWKRWLHSAWGKHYSIAVGSGMRYYEETLSITGSDLKDDGFGGGSIALPKDAFVHIGVDYQESDRWTPLYELMTQERNWLTSSSNSKPEAFAVIGQKLHIYPKPAASTAMRFLYVPQPKPLRNASDDEEFDVITTDGEEFIIWSMVVKALAKEESDTRDAKDERDAAELQLREWTAERSLHSPRRRIVEPDPGINLWGSTRNDPGNYRY